VLTKVTAVKTVHFNYLTIFNYFNSCNFSKHKTNVLPDDGVTVTRKHVGAVLM